MAASINSRGPTPTDRPASRFPTGFVVVALFVVAGAVFWRPILGLIVVLALSGTRSRPVPPAEAVSHVAGTFIRWGIVAAVPEADPDRERFANSVKGQVRVVNAVRYSSGIHGDGTDWYEVELSAGLADEMRASIARSPAVHKATGFYSDDAVGATSRSGPGRRVTRAGVMG